MTREEFTKGLLDLARRDKEFASIDPFEMVSPRQVSILLNIPMGSLKNKRQGTEVLTRINVSSHEARRPSYQFNRREVVGLLRIRQAKPSPQARAKEIYQSIVRL